MSLATLLDRNKAFAATDPAATVRADVTTLLTASQLSPNIMVSGYVYNTAALDTVVGPAPVGQHQPTVELCFEAQEKRRRQ
jgi:hypothetical protein